jgi:hypothetical protein
MIIATVRNCSQLFITVRTVHTVRQLFATVRTARIGKIFLCGTAYIIAKKGVRKILIMHMPHSEKQTLVQIYLF